ncbi:MAG: hypothetical protein P8M72_13420 [Gammaproteobacteria bacterium]|nr:hypothetical protein [Gammaproteobacteria bacterium]
MLKTILLPVALLLTSSLIQAQTEWLEDPLSEGTFSETETPFHQGDYEILVPAYSDFEYSINMEKDDVIVYTWTADMAAPELMDVEFHGHTDPVDGKGMLMFFKVHNEGRGNATVTAPYTGGHGWYFNNHGEQDVLVKLHISGFYSEIE